MKNFLGCLGVIVLLLVILAVCFPNVGAAELLTSAVHNLKELVTSIQSAWNEA